MIELSWTAAAILTLGLALTYCLYKFVVQPLRLRRFYRSVVSPHYKAYFGRFNPLIPEFTLRLLGDGQKYGDSFYSLKFTFRDYQMLFDFVKDSVIITLVDPQLIREYYEKHNQGYYKKSTNDLFVASFKFILGSGLLFAEGHEWKMKRKIMTNVFNFDFIKTKIPAISKIAKQTLDKVEKLPQNAGKDQIKIDLDDLLQQIFGNVVVKCFFGDIRLDGINGQSIFQFFNRMSIQNTKRTFNLYSVIMGPKFIDYNLRPIDRRVTKMHKQFNRYVENIIKQQLQLQTKSNQEQDSRNSKLQSKGIIQLVIKNKLLKDQKQEANAEKNFYSTQDLIDQFKTFFSAGTETNSSNVAIVLYQIAKNKAIQNKARQEIEAVIGNDLQNITYEKIKQLKYIDKCQKEVLRMYSPAPAMLFRQAAKDHFLGSIPIKAGTIVSPTMVANQFKTEFYENPQVFDPDRWDTIDLKKADPFSFFPFSAGQRNCIGQHLALIEGKIAIVHILNRYKQIRLQKQEFKYVFKILYGAQKMVTTFVK